MTNREKLIQEISEMSSAELAGIIMEDVDFNYQETLRDMMCEDCYREHEKCMLSEGEAMGYPDTQCPITMKDWLERECRVAALLEEARR